VDGLGDIHTVAALPDRFLIAGRRGNVLELWTSPDGMEWTAAATSFRRRSWVSDVVTTPSRYLAIGSSETSGDVMWASPHLVAWEPVALPCAGDTVADLIGAAGDTVLVAGLCNGEGTIWIITDVACDAVAYPAPFGGGYEIVHDGDAWYVHSSNGLWRSEDATTWTAVRIPSAAGEWMEWMDIAVFDGSLLLAADGEGHRGRLWRRSNATWERVGGAFDAGESFYSGATLLTGPAGILVSWNVGYPPSAHAEQSPAVIERAGWTVLLYRPGMAIAAEILDGDGGRFLQIDFPEPGAGPPDGIEIGEATVRFLHPDTPAALVELTFDEIEEAIHLDRPQRHAWWSHDGASWAEIDPPPVGHLHFTVVGTDAVVAAHRVTIRTLPDWVSRLAGELGEDVSYVWLWIPE
jgi:hypothetical protein